MEDITNSDTKYNSHNNNGIQKPYNVALNRERGVEENLVYDSGREEEQATQTRRNGREQGSTRGVL